MIAIAYEPALIEGAVHQEMWHREAAGDLALVERYHELAEPLYLLSEEALEAGFTKLYEKLFAELGFERLILEALDEFPTLIKQIEGIFLKRAARKAEEEADLVDNFKTQKRWLVIALRPVRFSGSSLKGFLRHELMHIADMLDAQFAYKPAPLGATPAKERLFRQRYGLLWCISIDSRLAYRGQETEITKEERSRQFQMVFEMGRETFEALWSAQKFLHRELVEIAQEPTKIYEWAGLSAFGFAKPTKATGSPCPLCSFPTCVWATSEQLIHIAVHVQRDFPTWQPSHGVCDRCREFYQMRTEQTRSVWV